jgi:PhoPQ-activated pathogenicity-related protein
MKIDDPLSYMDRYTMPTFVINAGGDEFFLPDNQYASVYMSMLYPFICLL